MISRCGARSLRARGFTLIEAMVVVALITIVSTLAAPSFGSLIGTMRARTAASDLVLDLTLARSEAIKRNADVLVAPVTAGDWSGGWQVTSAGTVLKTRPASGVVTFTGLAGGLTFQSNGRTGNIAENATWTVASPSAGATPRCIIVGPTGSARAKAGACV